ncbi:tol-pal system protein YbgF [Desulfurobacterium sp.]|uniref:tol-pal system protein YbgF n=1 Tax=Desulfurobacterium sp. TaxID=2004706 RepID=UPI0026355659|nr:tol-pal system protein YbgF [Desulfurobacterium sp.]
MKKILVAAVFPLLLAGCVQTQPINTTPAKQESAYDKKLEELEKRISSIEAKSLQNSAQIKTLNERVARVEDRLVEDEKEIYELKKTSQQTQKVLKEITVSAKSAVQPENQTEAAPQETAGVEQPSAEVQTPEVINVSDEDIYKKAFNAMESGELDTARILFETLVKRYPDSPLADNSLYWIGEIFYSHGDYATALDYFKKVVDNYSNYYPSPKGNKVPAALLKEALCYKGLGDNAKAKQLLKKLISKYPSTNEAAIAKVKLMELGD